MMPKVSRGKNLCFINLPPDELLCQYGSELAGETRMKNPFIFLYGFLLLQFVNGFAVFFEEGLEKESFASQGQRHVDVSKPKVEIVRYLNVSFQQVGIPYAGTKVDEEKSSWLGSILEMMRTTSMKKNCDDPESFKINWRNCVFKRRNLSMYAYNPYVSSV